MSRYFDALNRLIAEYPAQPTLVQVPELGTYGRGSAGNGSPAAAPRQAPNAPPRAEPLRLPPPARSAGAQSRNRFTTVLERVHESCGTLVGAAVVVAPASSSETVSGTVTGIAEEAERTGLKTLTMTATAHEKGLALAIFSRGGRGADVPSSLQRLVTWDSRGDASQGIEQWLEDARSSFDFVVVSVPMLASTPASARLARACDGLVIVAQAHVTQRRDLELAAERARISECNVLGLVFAEPYSRLKELLGLR